MGRAIKLILYYLAYQLLFIFLATGTDATIALIGGADITANFRPGTMAISIGMLLSALAMTWHLVHFHYVKFNKKSMHEVSKKIILLCIPLLLSAQFIAGILNEALDLTDTNQELFISMSHNIFGVLSIAIVVPILEEFLFRGAIEGHLLRKGWSPKSGHTGFRTHIRDHTRQSCTNTFCISHRSALRMVILSHRKFSSRYCGTHYQQLIRRMDHVHSHPRGTQPNDYGDLGHNNHLHSLSTSHNRFYRYVSLPEQILAETYQHTSQSY